MKLIKIGRAPENDIVLSSAKVSNYHAEIILLNNGDMLLEDKNRHNGTFHMTNPITPGTPVTVRRGDYIRFADTDLQWSQVPMPDDNSKYRKIFGIGSHRLNDIQVMGNTVSRFHATLKEDKQGRTFIEDHSTNGTTVNGKRIVSHQDVRLKRNDAVTVGGVNVDLKNYIKPDTTGILLKALGGLAAVAAVVAVVMLAIKPKPEPTVIQPPQQQVVEVPKIDSPLIKKQTTPPVKDPVNPPVEALMKATVYVLGSYYIDVTLEDDPFAGYSWWPRTFRFGWDGSTWVYKENTPFFYEGTAFFISQYGELGTNRHVAVPWTEDIESVSISAKIKSDMKLILESIYRNNATGTSDNDAKWTLAMTSKLNISGHHDFLGVLLSGQAFSSTEDFMRCQVIAESGDKNKDVAILRLNTQQTPDFIVNRGYYNISTARLNESELRINESLCTIGYPQGSRLGMFTGNGKEMTPTYTNLTVSKKPDEYSFQVQGFSLGGASGSPVIDNDRNLVGILFASLRASNNVVFICNIKHLVNLYEQHKVK